MKAHKIKKRWLVNFVRMYRELGLISDNAVDPSKVLMNKKDLTTAEKLLRKACKKEFPHYTKNGVELAVGMYMLNLAPAESEAIQQGYILVIDGK